MDKWIQESQIKNKNKENKRIKFNKYVKNMRNN